MPSHWRRLACAALLTACAAAPATGAHAEELVVNPHVQSVGSHAISLLRPQPSRLELALAPQPSIDVSFTDTGQMVVSGQNFPPSDAIELVVTIDPNSLFGGTLFETPLLTAGPLVCRNSRACTNRAPGSFVSTVDPSALAALQCGDNVGVTASDAHGVSATTAFQACFPSL